MLIGSPRIVQGERTVVTATVDGRYLWFSVPNEYGDYVTTSADPFVIGTLITAMQAKKPLEIRGSVSERLLYNLPRVMTLLSQLIKDLKPIGVRVSETHGGQPSAGVASGFSGGVDSFCLLADHQSPPVKLTHLVYNKVGAHPSDQMFRQHFEHVRPAAERLGLPMIDIQSNLDDFISYGFQQTHTLRNVSALMVLQGLFGEYLYASAFHYRDVCVGRAEDTAYMDALLLPLLSTEQMRCASVGSEYTRTEKTLRVASLPASYELLDVCVNPWLATGRRPNCSVCWKCCRTQLTLEIAGKLDLYESVFDLDAWRKVRGAYLREVRSSRGEPLLREVDDFAREQGYSMPSMVVSQVASIPRRAKQTAHALERKAMEMAPRALKDKVKSLLGGKEAAAAVPEVQ